MRVLIGHHSLSAFGGTETYMLSVAEQLTRTGHDVRLYAPQLGPMADVIRARGTRVAQARDLPEQCELVIAQDATSCLELWRRYPDAVRIFVAHSALHMLQTPPQIPGSYQALVVLNDRTEEWAEALAWRPQLVRLRQPVDLERFRLAPARRAAPPRVLVLSNYPFGSRAETVTGACEAIGAQLRWVGAAHASSASPEDEIAASDIVIGLGRSVLDAMAGARAALVLGPLGGDGWVSEEVYPELERDGFGGRASARRLDLESLTADLAGWDPNMGSINRELIARHHDVRHHAEQLIGLAREIGPPEVPPTGVEEELARLVRVEWQRATALYATRRENARLQSEVERMEARLAQAHVRTDEVMSELASLTAKLTSVLTTRRYRIASSAARTVERLRARRRLKRTGA